MMWVAPPELDDRVGVRALLDLEHGVVVRWGSRLAYLDDRSAQGVAGRSRHRDRRRVARRAGRDEDDERDRVRHPLARGACVRRRPVPRAGTGLRSGSARYA